MRELEVEEIYGAGALEGLRAEWQSLFAACGAPPFLSWEWLSVWQKAFGEDRSLRVLTVRSDGRLLGLLPLNLERRRLKWLPVMLRRLSMIGEDVGGSDYLDVLALPGYEFDVVNAITAHLERTGSFDILDLDGLPADSSSLSLLTRYFADNLDYRLRILPRDLCPQIRIDDWDDVLRQCQRVSYFNRSVKRLRKLPQFEFRVILGDEAPDLIDEAFERFLRLHEMAWAGRGGSGATGTLEQKAFLRDVIGSMAAWLRIEEIWIEGECRASLIGFEDGERFYFYLNGYDTAWSKYSLGFTILWMSIESAARRGVRLYDLLRGSEPYKFFWANSARATVTAQVTSRTLPARLYLAGEYLSLLMRTLMPQWLKSLFLGRKNNRHPDESDTFQQEPAKQADLKASLPGISKPTYQQ